MTVYEHDNDKLIGELLTSNWSLPGKKPSIYYDEGKDVSSHTFATDPIAIKVYIGSVLSTPQGIGFDSERLNRGVSIDIRGRKREDLIIAKNEIRRIMAKYRIYPGEDWDLLVYVSELRIEQTYNYYHQVMGYVLKKYFNAYPSPERTG